MMYRRISRSSTVHRLLLVAAGLALVLAAAAPAWAAQPTSRALLLQGDRYAAQGKWDSARAAYVRALEAGAVLDQDYLRCRNLGRAYMKGKEPDYAEAAKWLARALALRPNARDLRPLLARSRAESGDFQGAAEQYGLLAKAQPANSKYLLAWANSLVRSGDSEQAVSAVQAYMEKHPADAATRLDFARMLTYDRSTFDEAIRQYQAVLRADPNNSAAQVGVAKVMSWQDRLDISLELYDKVLARDPQNYDALVGKAFTLMWMKRKNEAQELFETAASRNPADREVTAALQSLEAPPPPPPASPVKPPVDVVAAEKAHIDTLMAAGAEAAARGNYVEAIHQYHRVLEQDPQNLKAKLQIARVLSWSKNYAEADVEYEELLRATPENQVVRRERARILSWDSKFDRSLAEYAQVLKDAEATRAAGQPEQISIDDTRLEYARVFSWAKRYDEALAQFDLLLPEGAVREPKHKDLLLEKARILAWSRRYDQSIATYNQALMIAPGDFDARLGMAQANFWAGRTDEAATLLRPLLDEQPKNPQVSFSLASVENSRGHRARALDLLEDAPKDQTTLSLRASIRERLRPILHLRYGFENDNEIPADPLAPSSVYRAHRYTAVIEFYPHPDVRVEVFNTVTDSDTSNRSLARLGNDGLATETFARVDFRPASWLQMILGAGGGTSGRGCPQPLAPVPCPVAQDNRRQTFLYEVHPIVTYHDFRLEFLSTRRLAEYTPLSIHDNVVRREESIAASYFWHKRVMVGGEYYHASYSLYHPDVTSPQPDFETAANGGLFFVRPTVYQSDKLRVDAGFRLEVFSFDDRAVQINNAHAGGFWTPDSSERYLGTGHISWDPHPRLNLDFSGSFGKHRSHGFPATSPPPAKFANAGGVSARITLKLGRWQPYLSYGFSSSGSPSFPTFGNGAFRAHSFTAGLSYRF